MKLLLLANLRILLLLLLVQIVLDLGKVEIFTGSASESIKNVETSRLKVRRRVVALRYE